jgi:hypothetical protein
MFAALDFPVTYRRDSAQGLGARINNFAVRERLVALWSGDTTDDVRSRNAIIDAKVCDAAVAELQLTLARGNVDPAIMKLLNTANAATSTSFVQAVDGTKLGPDARSHLWTERKQSGDDRVMGGERALERHTRDVDLCSLWSGTYCIKKHVKGHRRISDHNVASRVEMVAIAIVVET